MTRILPRTSSVDRPVPSGTNFQTSGLDFLFENEVVDFVGHPRFVECQDFIYDINGDQNFTLGNMRDTIREQQGNISISRRHIRSGIGVFSQAAQVTATGARFIATRPREDRYQSALAALKTPNNIGLALIPVCEQLAGFIVEATDELDEFTTVSQEIARDLEARLIAGDISTEYTLLRQLTDQNLKSRPLNDETIGQQTLLSVLLHTKSPILDYLSEQLEEGAYHSSVAHDLLTDAVAQERPTNGTAKIRDMVRFTGAVTNIQDQNRLLSRIAHVHTSWPQDQQATLTSRMTYLHESFRDNLSVTQLRGGNILFGTADPETEFAQALQTYYASLEKTYARSTIHDFHKAEIMRARAAEKRSKRRTQAQVPAQEVEIATEKARKPLELVRLLAKDGSVEPSDSASFEAMKEDYLGKAPGELLEKDLERVLHYCKTSIDFTSGRVGGLRKMANLQLNIGDTMTSLFEFKPKDAAGLSLVSARGKKMRLLLTLLDDAQLGVIKISDRDELTNSLRSLGFGTGGNRGNK